MALWNCRIENFDRYVPFAYLDQREAHHNVPNGLQLATTANNVAAVRSGQKEVSRLPINLYHQSVASDSRRALDV